MARPKRDQLLDLSQAHELTFGLIDRLACPVGKLQAFLRDTKAPGLRVRVTSAGAKSFVFEAKLNRQTIRRTIGDARAWRIDDARAEANRLRVTLDCGNDPRELERQRLSEKAAEQAAAIADLKAAKVAGVTVGEVWAVYVEERRQYWGALHYRDHIRKAAPGGEISRRGTRGRGVTVAGPLFPLMALPLRHLDAATIEAWAAQEGKIRATSARLAWRCLKVFLSWCEEQPVYAALLPTSNPAKTKKTREALGRAGAKQDALQREQLPAWFEAVRQIGNQTTAAYLQVLLLTGARPGEVLELRWADVNKKWKGLTIRDKVEGERTIPATPYVLHLLADLPRRIILDEKTGKEMPNPWVFSSPNTDTPMSKPHKPHATACTVAGIDDLTLHGLRRSFKSLTEWLEVPAGVVAQLMGHKPSATAEKHYTVRPLDLLRVHHEKIEAWILDQAGIAFEVKGSPNALRIVNGDSRLTRAA
jgi:integrase